MTSLSTWRPLLAALLALGAVAGATPGEWLPVPHPSLDLLEPAAAEQVDETRRRLDAALDDPSITSDRLVSAFGEVGQLYLLYDLPAAAMPCFENLHRALPDDPRPSYYLGVLQAREGRFDEAARRFRDSLALDPTSLAAWVRLGDAELSRGRLSEAETAYREGLSRSRDAPAARAGLGRIALRRQEHATARDHLEAALARQPWATALHHPLGLAYRGLGDLDAARHHLTLRGSEPVSFADPLIDQLETLNRSARSRLARGNAARRRGDLEAAAVAYHQAIAVAPDEPAAHLAYGALLLDLDRSTEAVGPLSRAVELDPGGADGRSALATALGRSGRLEEAVAQYDSLLELLPDDAEAMRWRATALAQLGRHQQSAAAWEEILRRRPGDPVALFGRARALLGAGELSDALVAHEAGVAALPEHLALRDGLARLLATFPDPSRRNPQRALELALATERAFPAPRHAATVALALAALGRFPEATVAQQRAIEAAREIPLPETLQAELAADLELLRQGRPPAAPRAAEGPP